MTPETQTKIAIAIERTTKSPQGAETIDGSATYVINSDYDSITLYSDGNNWYII